MKKLIERNYKPNHIYPTYVTTDKTSIIIPVQHIEYSSLVLEPESVYHVRQTPLEIIEHSCEMDCTTYAGRRTFIKRWTNYQYKLPALTHKQNMDIFVPTKSANQFDCIWINPNKVINYYQYNKTCIIIFENDFKIDVETSYHTINTQFQREYRVAKIVERLNKQYNRI